jgi:hypothetical protein
MAKKFDDARLSIGYLRAMASRRKIKRSARAAQKERDALRQLYGRERPVSPADEFADESDSVSTNEKVFHAPE